jgi:quercetin dioxygenase-like cupin family protein
MRTLITGVDAQGKSCVVSWDNLTMDTIGTTFAIGVPHAVTSPLPARPVGTADLIDQHLAAGDIRWMVIDYGPDAETPMHRTDTLDLETVLTGKVDLILDDGVHHLEQGDMVVRPAHLVSIIRDQQTNAGMESHPRTVDVRDRRALPRSTCHSGNRLSTSSSATRASRRARGAPTQKWAPRPKVKWRPGFRWISKRSGSSKHRSSRLADANMMSSALPAGTA